nr:4-hydroxy-tetrahydrodipicolinate synthase [Dokdonella immobilis]
MRAQSILNLSGSICAVATPFGVAEDALDLEAMGRLIEHQLQAGTRGLVIAGSTGEGAALEGEEFSELVGFAVRKVAGRVPVLAGTGMQSTRKTIAQTRLAAAAGADAALVVTPAYVRPTQDGLYRHYVEVAEKGGLPVMLYNVPSRSACDLLPVTVARLCTHPGVIGIKEARPEAERMNDLLALKSADFCIFSGDDPTCARAIAAGADGVISVAANVAPAAMQGLCLAAADGRGEDAANADRALQGLYDLLGVEPNPIPVKWCLEQLGFCANHLRLPLVPLSAAYHAQGKRVLFELGLIQSAQAHA